MCVNFPDCECPDTRIRKNEKERINSIGKNTPGKSNKIIAQNVYENMTKWKLSRNIVLLTRNATSIETIAINNHR